MAADAVVRDARRTTLPEYVPDQVLTSPKVIERVRNGLPAESLEWLQEQLGVTGARLAEIVHISRRTMSRRKEGGRLKMDESERVLRLIRLFDLAVAVLGGSKEARRWLGEPNFALGEESPLEYTDTEPGARRVEALLGQIDGGISA